MSISKHLSGVILKERNIGENDKFITFYSQEQGKVEILVRGVRKINSKLNPIISARFSFLDLVVIKGKNFYRLIDGETQEKFRELIKDYQKILLLNDIFKKVDELLKFQKTDEKILALILEFLRRMDRLPVNKALPLSAAFLIKLLAFVGYCPELRYSSVCQKSLSAKQIFFDLNKGIIICSQHKSSLVLNDAKIKLSQNCLEILRIFLYKDFSYLEKFDAKKQEFFKIWELVNKFLKWQTES
ncbi:DNA repair protein RecO [Candidatus Parcubacteria bacterium 4484_255]|nr:MAG: DNA repair protein RecO [Candidatus Parcubacteria bacterium 4484_255]